MKTIAGILAASALVLGGSAAVAKTRQTGEEKLATLLEGRVAGQPQRCISDYGRGSDVQVLDRVGIIYKAGSTVWVARVTDPESLRDRDILIVDRMSGSMLCRDDLKRTIDRSEGFLRSVVFFEDFVPYRRG